MTWPQSHHWMILELTNQLTNQNHSFLKMRSQSNKTTVRHFSLLLSHHPQSVNSRSPCNALHLAHLIKDLLLLCLHFYIHNFIFIEGSLLSPIPLSLSSTNLYSSIFRLGFLPLSDLKEFFVKDFPTCPSTSFTESEVCRLPCPKQGPPRWLWSKWRSCS